MILRMVLKLTREEDIEYLYRTENIKDTIIETLNDMDYICIDPILKFGKDDKVKFKSVVKSKSERSSKKLYNELTICKVGMIHDIHKISIDCV